MLVNLHYCCYGEPECFFEPSSIGSVVRKLASYRLAVTKFGGGIEGFYHFVSDEFEVALEVGIASHVTSHGYCNRAFGSRAIAAPANEFREAVGFGGKFGDCSLLVVNCALGATVDSSWGGDAASTSTDWIYG